MHVDEFPNPGRELFGESAILIYQSSFLVRTVFRII